MSNVGSIVAFGSTFAPAGYLSCDGSEYLISDYPELHAVIGYQYGGLLGQSFMVPDLRGEFLRGADFTSQFPGMKQEDSTAMPKSGFAASATSAGAHSHSYTASGINNGVVSGASPLSQPVNRNSVAGQTGSAGNHTHVVTISGGDDETRPQNMAVHYCICASENIAAGPEGPMGPQGPAGPAGATGATGAQGLMGPIGLTGATGAQGPAGQDGISRYEFTALEGASTTIIQTNVPVQGATGPQGPMGLPGAPGGATGATGAAGPQGPEGPMGPAGAPGASYDGPKQFAYACLGDGTELYNRGFQQVGVSTILGKYEYQFAEPLDNAEYAVVATLRNGQTNNHANVVEINKFGFVLRIGKSATKPNNAPHSVIVMAN